MSRIDLSAYQPDAWAEVRDHTLYGLNRALVPELLAAGLEPGADADATDAATQLKVLEPFNRLVIQYQVKAWHVCNEDGESLPEPKQVTDEHLRWCDDRIIGAVVEAANTARTAGDQPLDPKGASTASSAS